MVDFATFANLQHTSTTKAKKGILFVLQMVCHEKDKIVPLQVLCLVSGGCRQEQGILTP